MRMSELSKQTEITDNENKCTKILHRVVLLRSYYETSFPALSRSFMIVVVLALHQTDAYLHGGGHATPLRYREGRWN